MKKTLQSVTNSEKIISILFVLLILAINFLQAQSASELFKEGDFEEAREVLEKGIKVETGNYDDLLLLGRLYLYQNNFVKAEKFLKKAIEINPGKNNPKKIPCRNILPTG